MPEKVVSYQQYVKKFCFKSIIARTKRTCHGRTSSETMSTGLDLVSSEVYKRFERVLEELKLDGCTVTLEPLSTTKVNYTSFVVKARVHAEDARFFILKCGIKSEFTTKFFAREIYCYQKVLPELHQLQPDEGRVFYPMCFDSSVELNNEFLMLEDVTRRGYKSKDHLDVLDYGHVSAALKVYARLHALGFALRDQKRRVFDDLAKNLDENLFTNSSEEVRCIVGSACKSALGCCGSGEETATFAALAKTYIDAPNIFKEIFDKQLASEHSVFTHVDCRLGNLLFKYNKDGAVSEVCLVDWQLMTLASPAIDVLYVILVNTAKDLRDKHFEELIGGYYASFCGYLRKLGSDPVRLFPFETLREHMKTHGAYSLLFASCTLHIMFEVSDKAARGDKSYEKRMKDIITDCHNLGILRDNL